MNHSSGFGAAFGNNGAGPQYYLRRRTRVSSSAGRFETSRKGCGGGLALMISARPYADISPAFVA